MAKSHGPQIKDDRRYEALKKSGMSKSKAARIANTPAKKAGHRGGKSPKYEEWNKDDLQKQAARVGISGRSSMSKSQLISALRHH